MELRELCVRIEALPLPTLIRESNLIFPWIESFHVIAMSIVFGGIMIVDLRLLGLTSKTRPITVISREMLPWIWGAFALSVVTGLLLFSSSASRYLDNIPYRLKMLVLSCAGLNMIFFHFVTWRDVQSWDRDVTPPAMVQFAGGLSILLWLGVIGLGRWIGFTL